MHAQLYIVLTVQLKLMYMLLLINFTDIIMTKSNSNFKAVIHTIAIGGGSSLKVGWSNYFMTCIYNLYCSSLKVGYIAAPLIALLQIYTCTII